MPRPALGPIALSNPFTTPPKQIRQTLVKCCRAFGALLVVAYHCSIIKNYCFFESDSNHLRSHGYIYISHHILGPWGLTGSLPIFNLPAYQWPKLSTFSTMIGLRASIIGPIATAVKKCWRNTSLFSTRYLRPASTTTCLLLQLTPSQCQRHP